MNELKFRKAIRSDIEQIVDIIIGEPEQVSTQVGMKLFGIKQMTQTKRFFTAMSKATENWRFTTLAEMNGEIVGILQISDASLKMTLGLLITAVFLYGPFFMRKLIPRIQLQKRVQTQAPPDAYKIAELHVSLSHRGQGIGSRLLNYAEQDARATGYTKMALQTWTSNPARNLYERNGFTIVDTRTDEEFEHLTGTSGNHLMVKELH
ncbi:MAG: GNAT family N-acetyltransferase [Chloroflexi bacterium]|nr:GNAT family N-acetyltransferase [Chloroflexota bacterium]